MRSRALLCTVVLFFMKSMAQDYPSGFLTWPVPDGGEQVGGNDNGYSEVLATNVAGDVGTQTWFTRDLDGDGNMDLVVCSEKDAAGHFTTFDPGPDTHWNVFLGTGSGFSATPTAWSLPAGGQILGGIVLGFIYEYNGGGGDSGSNAWRIDDLDGDGAPDLVVMGVRNASIATSFSPNDADHWKVYLNTGSGFASTPVIWSVPDGGRIYGGDTIGFPNSYNVLPFYDDEGSAVYAMYDVDADHLPDLLVTGAMSGPPNDYPTGFSPNANSYWKVYRNNGAGFNTAYDTWPVPDGGDIHNGIPGGFYVYYSADVNGSLNAEQWNLRDLDGDGYADLVVTARNTGLTWYSAYGTGADRYWKVYLGSATGFASTSIQWPLPDGGLLLGGVDLSINALQAFAAQSFDLGSIAWYTTDMNGDGLPDLLVTGSKTGTSGLLMSAFDAAGASYWKLYANNGSGFDAVHEPWYLPSGGISIDGDFGGFSNMAFGPDTDHDLGSEAWSSLDLDGSGTPDLVVTSARAASLAHVVFGTTGAHHWKVFLNPYTVGLPEPTEAAARVHAFPSPTTGPLSIFVGGLEARSLRILDPLGVVVASTSGGYIDLRHMACGTYIVEARDASGRANRTLVVKQ